MSNINEPKKSLKMTERTGTNRKYPWEKIPVDKSITIKMRSQKAIKSAINSAYGYGERTGKKFTIKRSNGVDEDGQVVFAVKIWRLS